MPNMVFPLHLVLCSSLMPCLFHVNQLLNCRVVKQLEPYTCVSEFRFRLIWISCIASNCHVMHTCFTDHVDSFAIVSFASIVCCSVLLLLE
jgi:hypothetical protein